MVFIKKKEEKKSTTEVCSEMYTHVKTCCPCEIYLYVVKTYDYTINLYILPTNVMYAITKT